MGVVSKQLVVLPGDDEKPTGGSDPTVVLQEGIREIVDTTIGDRDAPKGHIRRRLAEETDDWGDGFYVDPVPVLITRGPDGSITRTQTLNEIPGVHYERGQMVPDEKSEVKEVDAVPTPHPLGRADRTKLVTILARRLYAYYRDRGPNDPRFNPFRDGIPELPSGSPAHIQPLPGTLLYPATDGQIMAYLTKFVGDRATVINRNRFGKGIEDLALRIE